MSFFSGNRLNRVRPRAAFTPLQKAAGFSRRLSSDKAGGGVMPSSAQTVRERSSPAGFTLIELMVVVIIVGILCTLAYPNYVLIHENALSKDAQSALLLIASAEKVYRSKSPEEIFVPAATTAAVNQQLGLILPVGAQWNYAAIAGTNFCVQAQRTVSPNRAFHMHLNGSSVDTLPQPCACAGGSCS